MIAPAGGYGVAGAGGDPGDLRLITIPISHYCEKARWALERSGLPYREQRDVQGSTASPPAARAQGPPFRCSSRPRA